ncbi:MAG TPA: DUF4255 domain-containing protein [Candidatus Acidoferrales bacterium]|jgi:hypothetical protein|nr:DUF4255 domain-containing protein [Candidatus Acidoferrales bacterium]
MSNFLAIGGVSATFQTLLRDRMELPQGTSRTDLQVTVSIPQAEDAALYEKPRVNLFLYRVTENAALKNQMIPGQGHPSEYGHPPLSLVLHYLVTAYGATDDHGVVNETRSQFLLGGAMRVFHDHPIITEQLVTIQAPAGQTILHQSLRGEFEQVKLSLDPISLEDLSKVWTALTRPYRLSAAYSVSVVQIESRRLKTLAAPVQTRRIHIAIAQRPEIDAVYRTPVLPGEAIGDTRAHVLQQLTIEGRNFRAAQTWVKLGGLEPVGVQPFSDGQIRIQIPDDTYPIDAGHPVVRPIPVDDRLRPGAQTVEVQTLHATEVVQGGLDNGVVVLDGRRQLSNQSVFMLAPEVSGVVPALGGVADLLTVNGRRLYQPPSKSVIIVGDVSIPVQEPGPGDPWAIPTDTSLQVPLTALTLTTPPLGPGFYQVRAMVNGSQSLEDVVFQLT